MLSIIPLSKKYLEMLRVWRNMPEIRCNFKLAQEISVSEQLKWWEAYQHDDKDYIFIVHHNDNPIGAVGFKLSDDCCSAEFGRLMIGEPNARGKKYGEKITRMICDHAIDKFNLQLIWLEVFKLNLYAIQAYKK